MVGYVILEFREVTQDEDILGWVLSQQISCILVVRMDEITQEKVQGEKGLEPEPWSPSHLQQGRKRPASKGAWMSGWQGRRQSRSELCPGVFPGTGAATAAENHPLDSAGSSYRWPDKNVVGEGDWRRFKREFEERNQSVNNWWREFCCRGE